MKFIVLDDGESWHLMDFVIQLPFMYKAYFPHSGKQNTKEIPPLLSSQAKISMGYESSST
jgi:hypothetical protein